MDLDKLIRQLKEEKERVDQTIAALEAIWRAEHPEAATSKRKGRKNMPERERAEVSRRMKQYWVQWRRGAKPARRRNVEAGTDPSTS
jgi:hypothetical protein